MTLAAVTAGMTCAGFAQTTTATANMAANAAPASGIDSNSGHVSQPAAQPEMQLTVEQELAALKSRIEQLEGQVKQQNAAITETNNEAGALTAAEKALVGGNKAVALNAAVPAAGMPAAQAAAPQTAAAALPAPPDPHAPAFSDWDWTWLNGNPRNKDVAFDSKFFTPEIRADITYNYDFNRPIDDTIADPARSSAPTKSKWSSWAWEATSTWTTPMRDS